MKPHNFHLTFFLSCSLLLVSQPSSSAKLYKWVDGSGKTSFSDQISPEEAKYRRETLSKKGRVVDITEQEKTKEEKERDNRLSMLREKQEKIIANQKAHDDSLLRSYHSKEEMIAELKTKIAIIEGQKKLIESAIVQQLERLDVKQKSAATFERNAQPVPANLIQEIKNIQIEIEKTKSAVNDNLAQQKRVSDEYDNNIKRFLVLTQPDDAAPKNIVASIEEANALGLFRCENDTECKKAWAIARTFVDTHSTTPADINTDNLVMHEQPSKDTDISLSISKIASKDDEDQLFLDIHCRESSLGKELCSSPKVQELRTSFRPYVNERLINKVPTP
ncbi:MAG: DUF4124 domain-containing protein [Methylococcales bacterium]